MSRRPTGHQRTWTRDKNSPCPFLWPWQTELTGSFSLSPDDSLALLERVWTSSRNFAALYDALRIITKAGVACHWVTTAAADVLRDPSERTGWSRQYERDLKDVVRANYYCEGRDAEDGLGLSRAEAAKYASDMLRGTEAATTWQAVLKLIVRMNAAPYGRYYLPGGSAQWQEKHYPRRFPKDPEQRLLVLKWRHRAVLRGNAALREAEKMDMRYIRQGVSKGDKRARLALQLYTRAQSEAKLAD